MQEHEVAGAPQRRAPRRKVALRPVVEANWYKTAIIYELHVRSFADGNADGIGDFHGLIEKLDYIQDLGVNAIWLLPFYPSPLKDDGYDIGDYYAINPAYGTLKDFKRFLDEAHARGLRVITELVLNHTSDQNAWFQRSRRAAPGSVFRDFYVWSDSPDKYKEVRIIFKDFEPSNWTWDPVAKAYYWHRFYAHQPDLNYDNPAVHDEVFKVIDYWLDMGVDGFRLDAVPYLYEREGTSGESLPETHLFLKKLRRHIDTKYGDRILLAEANQWPEASVSYFGDGRGDECHMAFHFPVMPRLFMGVRMEDRVPIVDILEQTPPLPESGQWALFLRNHDELTLEMVTDEERDYMYKAYAQEVKARINLGIRRRLAPLLGNNRRKIELLNLLLLSLPGTPVIYYGDEIGMGDNIFLGDRNGVRTPMQWSSDKNAGFSRAHPNALFLPIVLDPEYHYETINVETQQRNPSSLLWWMRRVLALRNRSNAFGLGDITFLHPENRKVLAFVRTHEKERILVVANLSRFAQVAQLDLSQFNGMAPVEMFGQTEFPQIKREPYTLSMGPHTAFWLALRPAGLASTAVIKGADWEPANLSVPPEKLFSLTTRRSFEKALLAYLRAHRRYAHAARTLTSLRIREVFQLTSTRSEASYLLLANGEHSHREVDLLAFMVTVRTVRGGAASKENDLVIARLDGGKRSVAVYDSNGEAAGFLLRMIAHRIQIPGVGGELISTVTPRAPRALLSGGKAALHSERPLENAVFHSERRMLRFSERLDNESGADLEFAHELNARFEHSVQVFGRADYLSSSGLAMNVGLLLDWHSDYRNGDEFTCDALGRFIERAQSQGIAPNAPRSIAELIAAAQRPDLPALAAKLGTFPSWLTQLGRRVGEMHLALAAEPHPPSLAPEEFTPFYQRSLYQSIRNNLLHGFDLLKKARDIDVESRVCRSAAKKQAQILKHLSAVYARPFQGFRIRGHGELDLRNVVHTGKDFLILPTPLDPRTTVSQRSIKRSPLRDVGQLLRSLEGVAGRCFEKQAARESARKRADSWVEGWWAHWRFWASASLLHGYFEVMRQSKLLPRTNDEIALLLEAHMVDRTMTELVTALEARQNRVGRLLKDFLRLCP